jgi:hypothetical protein
VVVLESYKTKGVHSRHAYNILTNQFIGNGFAVASVALRGDGLLPISTWSGKTNNPEDTLQHGNSWVHNILDLTAGKKILANSENYLRSQISEGIINITMRGQPYLYSYLVDRNGTRIPILPYEQLAIGPFKNGVAWYCIAGHSHGRSLMDRFGRTLSQEYKLMWNNSSGLSRVISTDSRKDSVIIPGENLYGFINALGHEIIPCQYFDASDFRNGMAIVQKMDSMEIYLINSFGEELSQLHGLSEIIGGQILDFLWKTGGFVRAQRNETAQFVNAQLINIDSTVRTRNNFSYQHVSQRFLEVNCFKVDAYPSPVLSQLKRTGLGSG